MVYKPAKAKKPELLC